MYIYIFIIIYIYNLHQCQERGRGYDCTKKPLLKLRLHGNGPHDKNANQEDIKSIARANNEKSVALIQGRKWICTLKNRLPLSTYYVMLDQKTGKQLSTRNAGLFSVLSTK